MNQPLNEEKRCQFCGGSGRHTKPAVDLGPCTDCSPAVIGIEEGEGKCEPEDGNCAHCGNLGPNHPICDNKCGCHRPSPESWKIEEHFLEATQRKATLVTFSPEYFRQNPDGTITVELPKGFLRQQAQAKADERLARCREAIVKAGLGKDSGWYSNEYVLDAFDLAAAGKDVK